jgi:hypothetical protein
MVSEAAKTVEIFWFSSTVSSDGDLFDEFLVLLPNLEE